MPLPTFVSGMFRHEATINSRNPTYAAALQPSCLSIHVPVCQHRFPRQLFIYQMPWRIQLTVLRRVPFTLTLLLIAQMESAMARQLLQAGLAALLQSRPSESTPVPEHANANSIDDDTELGAACTLEPYSVGFRQLTAPQLE